MNQQLVKKAKRGNKKAFDTLMKALSAEGYRLAYYYLKHQADSQDALGLAIEKAYNNISKLKEVDKFKQWFMSIVANEAKMIIRKNATSKVVPIESVRELTEAYHDREMIMDLKKALEHVEASNRMIVMMKYYEGYTFKEISEIIGVSESTVKTRNYAILKELKEVLARKERRHV